MRVQRSERSVVEDAGLVSDLEFNDISFVVQKRGHCIVLRTDKTGYRIAVFMPDQVPEIGVRRGIGYPFQW